MNLLEHYIKELEILDTIKYDFTTELHYKIKVKTICYGRVETKETIVSKKELETAKEKGYFFW